MPWHPGGNYAGSCGLFQFPSDGSPSLGASLVSGSWGEAGDAPDIVLAHCPPKYILDRVGAKKGSIIRRFGESVGCPLLLAKLRSMKRSPPAVVAFGLSAFRCASRGSESISSSRVLS